MKIKTSELSGPALDWAVAKAESARDPGSIVWDSDGEPCGPFIDKNCGGYPVYEPSTDWAYGGLIIEREHIDIVWQDDAEYPDGRPHARMSHMVAVPRGVMSWCTTHGPTPLIAAMRCFVASRLGDEVDVPEELLT